MSNAPFDVSQVTRRLNLITELQQVGELAEYLSIKDLRGFRTPSAYVVMARESGTPKSAGNRAGHHQQLVGVLFGVIVAVRNYRLDHAERTIDLIGTVGQVRNCILGWTPDYPMATPCQFVSGEPLDSNDSTILWGEVYSTQKSIGSQS